MQPRYLQRHFFSEKIWKWPTLSVLVDGSGIGVVGPCFFLTLYNMSTDDRCCLTFHLPTRFHQITWSLHLEHPQLKNTLFGWSWFFHFPTVNLPCLQHSHVKEIPWQIMVPLLGTNMYSIKTQLAIKEFHTTLSVVVISNNRWSWHLNRSFRFSVPTINNLNRIYCLKACQNCDPSVVKPFYCAKLNSVDESNKVILFFLVPSEQYQWEALH